MGLANDKIIEPEELKTLYTKGKVKMSHIIIDKRGNFERFNYIRNIQNKYEP